MEPQRHLNQGKSLAPKKFHPRGGAPVPILMELNCQPKRRHGITAPLHFSWHVGFEFLALLKPIKTSNSGKILWKYKYKRRDNWEGLHTLRNTIIQLENSERQSIGEEQEIKISKLGFVNWLKEEDHLGARVIQFSKSYFNVQWCISFIVSS